MIWEKLTSLIFKHFHVGFAYIYLIVQVFVFELQKIIMHIYYMHNHFA
jgi:hypothetical protein